MAYQFIVLEQNRPAGEGERFLFLRDGFSLLALIFPLPWLVIKGLWLEAILLLAAYGAFGLMASGGEPLWILALYGLNMVAALWIALDGQHWLIEKHLARGAHVKTVIYADSRNDAELRFALHDNAQVQPVTLAPQTNKPAALLGPARTNDMLFATPWGNP